jgi:hypothetical protein
MRNLAVVASLAVVALANSATAELLTFDHLPSTLESSIPVGLGEFEWSADFEYLTGAEVGGGYANGDVSPPNVASTGTEATPLSEGARRLNSTASTSRLRGEPA